MLRLDLSTAPSPVEVSAHVFGSVKNSSGTYLVMNKAYFRYQIGFILDPMDESEVTLDELQELYGNKDNWNSIFNRFTVSLNQGYSIASTTTNIGTLDINCSSFSDYYVGNVNPEGSFTPGFEFIFESASDLPTVVLQPEDTISIEALIEYTIINEQFATYLSNKNILPLVFIYYELIY